MPSGAVKHCPQHRERARWIELASDTSQLELSDAVRAGLTKPGKTLPSQFFYDAEGSRLFEAICDLPEYYLTRAEAEILDRFAPDLAARVPDVHTIIELGSGSSVKTETLLRAFEDRPGLCYAPIDVSESALEQSIARISETHSELELRPAIAEYEAGFAELRRLEHGPTLTLWLGSSIGNLEKPAAVGFLRAIQSDMRETDRLLVGIDLRKDRGTLEAAYNDAQGVTARFNLNLLSRINRELAANFDLSSFRHVVQYDEDSGSVQSFVESQVTQTVAIDALDLEVAFETGERIHTEDSHKYSIGEIDQLAADAGLRVEERYFDLERRFALNLFAPIR